MLLDPPFRLAKKHGDVGQAEYRSPNLRPKVEEEFYGDEIRQTFRQAFCRLLVQRCSADRTYLMTCATDIFLVLYEGYRIIASEWLVVNEYVKRELANIEHHLEKSESTFRELEQHLKELYRIRRRCNKDRELVTEAATQCKKRGQALWPSSKATPDGNIDIDAITFVERHAQELEEDLKYVFDNMSISISRIEKNITLLMALVTISEGRQGLQENRGIATLTFIATIFLPFGTVATILGIQTQYGPGASGFWMLWAVALPLTVLVIIIPFLFPAASATLNQLWDKCFQANPKTTCEPLSGLQDEGIELSDRVRLQMY
jgi:Mg2+ and Co2+ transporter CorA